MTNKSGSEIKYFIVSLLFGRSKNEIQITGEWNGSQQAGLWEKLEDVSQSIQRHVYLEGNNIQLANTLHGFMFYNSSFYTWSFLRDLKDLMCFPTNTR